MARSRPPAAPATPIDAVVRELANSLQRLAMYPAGHGLAVAAITALYERTGDALANRETFTIGVTPRGLVLDGLAADPPPSLQRDLAAKLHRRNIGTIHVRAGVTMPELASMVTAISAADAEDHVGREGLRLTHVRVEPLVYDVLDYADPLDDRDLDDVFWRDLVEAAFGRRLAETESLPTVIQIAEAITDRAQSSDGARRVYEALAGFSSALASRNDRSTNSARRRLVEVLAALSRPTTRRIVTAGPTADSRRRLLRDTLMHMPPALLLQLMESVAEADGDPISPQLRWLLGKLAGTDAAGELTATSAFAAQVTALIDQWEGTAHTGVDDDTDARLRVEGLRIVALGVELARPTLVVLDAALLLVSRGHLTELLRLLDARGNDPETVRQLLRHVLQPSALAQLLSASPIDFPLVERVAIHAGPNAVGPLLDLLSTSEERATRRRILDLLVRLAPSSEDALVARLPGSPWYLARNIFSVLSQLPEIRNGQAVLRGLRDAEPRVRHEALRTALRHPDLRDRAVHEAIEADDTVMIRTALGALERTCPAPLIAPVMSVLEHDDAELRLLAVGLLAETSNPLVVPALLNVVRSRGGFLRRTRLVPKSPLMLAALHVLSRRWATHRAVAPVMQLAARSSDYEIRQAMGRHQ